MKREITTSQTEVIFGKDDVVVQQFIADIPGGRTIDFTGWTGKDGADIIPAGTVIIKGTVSGATVYRPHPVASTTSEGVTTWAYDTITSGFSVVGVLYRTITRSNPQGSVLVAAKLNSAALPYAMTSTQKTALPTILFVSDEEA